MKLLHIGKAGNVDRYSPHDEFTRSVGVVSRTMQTPVDELISVAGDADFILADAMAAVPAGLIGRMPSLKLVQSEGVGFQFFDTQAAAQRGIYVCNARGMNATAVAEQALMLMIGVLRDAIGGDRAVREGRQIAVKEGYMATGSLRELADLKVGLYGFGAIAKALARVLSAMGVEVCYYQRRRADEATERELNVKYLPLDEMVATCDMISVHVPLTDETRNSIDDGFFSKMKDGSYIINTARGEVVDSEALVRAIKSGKIAGAGLDTIAGEPVQRDNVLVTQPEEIASRLLFSPHIGGITASSFRRSYAVAWNNIRLVAAGQRPLNVVNGL